MMSHRLLVGLGLQLPRQAQMHTQAGGQGLRVSQLPASPGLAFLRFSKEPGGSKEGGPGIAWGQRSTWQDGVGGFQPHREWPRSLPAPPRPAPTHAPSMSRGAPPGFSVPALAPPGMHMSVCCPHPGQPEPPSPFWCGLQVSLAEASPWGAVGRGWAVSGGR